MANRVMVLGTDTGIGKTLATAALFAWASERSQVLGSVITQKWVQCGDLDDLDIDAHHQFLPETGRRVDCDPVLKKNRLPYQLSLAASPHLASEEDAVTLDLETVKVSLDWLCSRYQQVIIEGAGGVLVPMTREAVLLDWVQELGLEVLLVIGNKVGCLNHSLLTLEAFRSRGIVCKGLIFSDLDRHCPEQVRRDNESYLASQSGVPVVMRLPYQPQSLSDLWVGDLDSVF